MLMLIASYLSNHDIANLGASNSLFYYLFHLGGFILYLFQYFADI